jgi:hypothetical protein
MDGTKRSTKLLLSCTGLNFVFFSLTLLSKKNEPAAFSLHNRVISIGGLSMRRRRQRPLPFAGGVSRSSGDGTVQRSPAQAESGTGGFRHRRSLAQALAPLRARQRQREPRIRPEKIRLGSGLFHRCCRYHENPAVRLNVQ